MSLTKEDRGSHLYPSNLYQNSRNVTLCEWEGVYGGVKGQKLKKHGIPTLEET